MYTYNAKVLRVIDGDTLRCDIDLGFGVSIVRIVKMQGIESYRTPERTSSILTVQDLAAKAIARARATLENKTVILNTQLDKTDLVMAYIYESQRELDSHQSFNLKLIQEGLAMASSPKCGDVIV